MAHLADIDKHSSNDTETSVAPNRHKDFNFVDKLGNPIKVNDCVVVDDPPNGNEFWSHSFAGNVEALSLDTDGTPYATIMDGDNCVYDIDLKHIQVEEL